MHSSIVPDDHHFEMKRKALEMELLAARKVELDAADAKQRKKILKEIEKAVHDKIKVASALDPSSFLIR